MIAFEILVNGKKLYTMGAGDFGLLSADIVWDRLQRKSGPIHQRARVTGRAVHQSDNTHSQWPDAELNVGDEITVRLVEVDGCDPPATRETLDEIKSRTKDRP